MSQLTGAMLAPYLPDDLSEDDRQAALAAASQLDPVQLVNLVADGMLAKQLADSGNKEEARAIVEPYRQMCESVGLTELFDQLVGSLLAD